MKQEKPTFHDISMLPITARLIRETLENTKDQYQTLTEVREKPHVLDDETVEHIIRVYTGDENDSCNFSDGRQKTRYLLQILRQNVCFIKKQTFCTLSKPNRINF